VNSVLLETFTRCEDVSLRNQVYNEVEHDAMLHCGVCRTRNVVYIDVVVRCT
jgi:hypothetical protein